MAKRDGLPLNNAAIAKDCGISPSTVKSYIKVLEDTFIGYTIPSYRPPGSKGVGIQSEVHVFRRRVAQPASWKKDLSLQVFQK